MPVKVLQAKFDDETVVKKKEVKEIKNVQDNLREKKIKRPVFNLQKNNFFNKFDDEYKAPKKILNKNLIRKFHLFKRNPSNLKNYTQRAINSSLNSTGTPKVAHTARNNYKPIPSRNEFSKMKTSRDPLRTPHFYTINEIKLEDNNQKDERLSQESREKKIVLEGHPVNRRKNQNLFLRNSYFKKVSFFPFSIFFIDLVYRVFSLLPFCTT